MTVLVYTHKMVIVKGCPPPLSPSIIMIFHLPINFLNESLHKYCSSHFVLGTAESSYAG